MEASDDAFLRFLVSHSGQTIGFLPGTGGLDDALTSLAFLDLCDGQAIACSPLSEGADVGTVVVGSVETLLRQRARLGDRKVVVLPGSVHGFADLEGLWSSAATVFWRDRTSQRMAILQGLPPDRALLCHDLCVHLDATTLGVGRGAAEGSLTVNVGGPPTAGSGDALLVRLDGGHGRWASPHRCRNALRGVFAAMTDAAEIRTDSPGLAIVAAQLGRTVRLIPGRNGAGRDVFADTIAPRYPAVALDPDMSDVGGIAELHGEGESEGAGRFATPDDARLRSRLAAAAREAQLLSQERERLFLQVAELQARGDAEAVAVVRSHRDARERAEEAGRLATDRLAEAETRAAQERHGAQERLAAAVAEGEAAAREAAAREAAAREAAAREAAAREAAARDAAEAREAASREAAEAREAASREAAAREAALSLRLAASDAALDTRTHQALALQSALDEQGARAFATEGRIARMRALIDARTTAGDDARRDAEALRRSLDGLVASSSWRLTRPLRRLSRGIKRLAGAAEGGMREGAGRRSPLPPTPGERP